MYRKVYIHCDGGFSNRFNILIGGLFLSKHFNLKPVILWNPNNFCGALFSDIFYQTLECLKFDSTTFFSDKNLKIISHENQFNQQLEMVNPNLFSSIDEVSNYIENDKDVFYFNNIIPNWVSEKFLSEDLNKLLKFKLEITNAVNLILQTHPRETYYGLHFRKTDFVGIEPVDDNYYHNYINQNINDTFFICSDDKQTEVDFLKHSNAFTFTKTNYVEKYSEGTWNTWISDSNGNQFPFNVNRNSQSVKEAVVDLLLLSNSKIIATNVNSTFLKIASLIKKYNLFR